MKIRTACTCPLEIVHDIMRGKWKTIIVFQLRNGGMGLAELERGIEGITQKMLLQHLGELRAFGLIGKIEPNGYPLRVTYFLTERGEKLLQAVRIMSPRRTMSFWPRRPTRAWIGSGSRWPPSCPHFERGA